MAGADERHDRPDSDPGVVASELAASLLVTSVDLPGFVPASAELESVDAAVARCAGVQFEPLAQVHSPLYSGANPEGTALSVGSAVSVLPSAASAQRFFESYRSTRTLDCIKDTALHELEQAGIEAKIAMSVIPTVSRTAVGIRSTVAPDRGRLQFTDTMIFVRGPALVSLGLYSSGSPPALSFEQRLVEVLIDRATQLIP